jgi:hypothetical protein
MNTEQRKSNEKYFLTLIKQKTQFYMWKDNANCYDLSSGKMKPLTLKGYVELSAIVRKGFMDLFVEMPTDGDWDKDRVWEIINAIK